MKRNNIKKKKCRDFVDIKGKKENNNNKNKIVSPPTSAVN